jgi:hypothetical protein
VGRSPPRQPRRRADPWPQCRARIDLRHRASPQRHPARTGHRQLHCPCGDGRRRRAGHSSIRVDRFTPAQAAE